MTTLVIIIHNRIDNLLHWQECLRLCPPVNTVVIHNSDQPDPAYQLEGMTYIHRPNIGYDIGAFADVCTGRLDIGHWDKLLWCCDDTFPMATDFVQQFEARHTEGVTCMELSPYVREHIRTTGFMIDRDTARRLRFAQITTKEDCYQFEHRSPVKSFKAQIDALSKPVVMVAPRELSPLWDIGYGRKLDRYDEHTSIFGPAPLPAVIEQKETVTVICPLYHNDPMPLIASLRAQTNQNWRLWLVHDGPGIEPGYLHALDDPRIEYYETHTRRGNWGHAIRAESLQLVRSKYVIITNGDNQYAPPFIERCLSVFSRKTRYVAVFCDAMAHSYKDWQVLPVSVRRGFIDMGGVMLKTEAAQAVGFNNITDHSADWLFFHDIAKQYGANNFVSFPGCMFIHN